MDGDWQLGNVVQYMMQNAIWFKGVPTVTAYEIAEKPTPSSVQAGSTSVFDGLMGGSTNDTPIGDGNAGGTGSHPDSNKPSAAGTALGNPVLSGQAIDERLFRFDSKGKERVKVIARAVIEEARTILHSSGSAPIHVGQYATIKKAVRENWRHTKSMQVHKMVLSFC